jgi:integrase
MRADAEAWALATEAAIMEGRKPVAAAPKGVTVSALFNRYARDVSPSKGGARWEILRLAALQRDFPVFAGPLADLTPEAMATWRTERLAQVSAHTVNREMNVISAVLNHAMKEWRTPGLVSNPVRAIKRPPIPAPRQQRVRRRDLDAILIQLGWDGSSPPGTPQQWVGWAFAVARETAMRKGEVLNLDWKHAHLAERWVRLPKTKNGHPRDVPLSLEAGRLLGLLTPGKGPIVPVASGYLDQLYRVAKAAAGLPHVRFHDARREALTNMAEKFSVMELANASGHRTIKTLMTTYYAPDASELAKKLD